jgi:putative peptide zinc metalloprotease protein
MQLLASFFNRKKGENYMWNKDSIVVFVAHEIHEDKKKYILEDKHSGDFYEMPLPAIDAIKSLSERKTINETEALLIDKYPEEEIDMKDFITQLIEMDLLTQIDEEVLQVVPAKKKKRGFLWIDRDFAGRFFKSSSKKFYIFSFFCSILLMILNPSSIPYYKDLFWSDIMLLNILLFSVLSIVLVLIHEAGHVLAARSLGISVNLGIGHRLFFPVLESDVSEVWKLGGRDRNRVYLAGINFDIAILFLSLFFQNFLLYDDPKGMLYTITAMMNFNIVLRLIYQCCFYMKTDLYFVVENITGQYNLMEEAKGFLRKKVVLRRSSKTEYGKMIKGYSFFYILGTFISIGIFLFYYLPQLFYAIKMTLPKLQNPLSSIHFWDGAIFLLQLQIVASILIYSWIRGLKHNFLKSK